MFRSTRSRPRKIGLALGSGAARGLAHIGVLKVLEEEQVPVDLIAGTSIGAMIGAFYAAGVPVKQIEEVALNVDWRRMARLIDPVLPTSGIIDGRKVAAFMSELLPVTTFEELRLPLAVVATDVESGESLIIRKGNLLEALRAAVAFPGIFTPVRFGDRFLIDGGVKKPVPGDVAREMGAEVVIGVCAIAEVEKRSTEAFLPGKEPSQKPSSHLLDLFNSRHVERLVREISRRRGRDPDAEEGPGRRPPNIFKVCAQSVAIMENVITDLSLKQDSLDLIIRPELNGITLLEFHRAAEAIAAGEQATRERIGELKKLARVG